MGSIFQEHSIQVRFIMDSAIKWLQYLMIIYTAQFILLPKHRGKIVLEFWEAILISLRNMIFEEARVTDYVYYC